MERKRLFTCYYLSIPLVLLLVSLRPALAQRTIANHPFEISEKTIGGNKLVYLPRLLVLITEPGIESTDIENSI